MSYYKDLQVGTRIIKKMQLAIGMSPPANVMTFGCRVVREYSIRIEGIWSGYPKGASIQGCHMQDLS